MNDLAHYLLNFDTTHLALIKETRVRIKSELVAASINVLRFSVDTQTLLHKAGFRLVRHLLHPSPEQINGVMGINEATKQEIRDRVSWAFRQANRHFRRQVREIWASQLAEQQTMVPVSQLDEPDNIPNALEHEAVITSASNDIPPANSHSHNLDQRIDQIHLFSPRAQTALMRSGILTLRLLMMHTPDLLILNTRNLGEKGLNEIRNVLAQSGLTLLTSPSGQPVTMICMLTAALYAHPSPCHLTTITQLLSSQNSSFAANKTRIAQAARVHPYLKEIKPELFQFDFRFAQSEESTPVDVYAPNSVTPEQVWPTAEREIADLLTTVTESQPQLEITSTKGPMNYLFRSAEAGWTGKPGSQLQAWELKLRQQFEQVAWIGQLTLTEDEFHTLCQVIRDEAKGVTIRAKKSGGQPKLVPAAAFITAMVFSARYAEQAPDEAVDEFWSPYWRTVWQVGNSTVFMNRCRKRFVAILPYLEQTFGFTFPRFSEGNLVTAIYRHALIPRYMQADFATWLRKSWRDILAVAFTPALLAAQLQQDRSLDYHSQRLKRFVTGKGTAETAAALIRNMAAAIRLHVNEGETIENIGQMLVGTPIEQELWREIAQEFLTSDETSPTSLRLTQPRLTWVWSLDESELALRVQNIILPADSSLEGDPARLVWLDSIGMEPQDAEIEVEVSPWRMKTGERIVNDLFLNTPDGPINGELVLLTDLDEIAARLPVPPHPGDAVQFFRLTQQGAYGIPVSPAQVSDGVWLVCAHEPLSFLNEQGEFIAADSTLSVPYPLDKQYLWAAQFNLKLPVTVRSETHELLTLTDSSDAPAIGRPTLVGTHPIAGLSRQVQPTFANTNLTLMIDYSGERLLKQASLWLQGQDGWRYQRSLAELRQTGVVTLVGSGLHLDLSQILPEWANFYTLEFRFSLQPAFSAPLQFAIVPGLVVEPPAPMQLYTPANPPHITLHGVAEATIVRLEGMIVEPISGEKQRITWTDLRHEPRLVLRFDQVDIPLAWSVKRFMAWLEPKAKRPFLTLAELHGATLYAVSSSDEVQQFNLSVSGQRGRDFPLKRGRLQLSIGQSQLYDMVRLAHQPHTVAQVGIGQDNWVLFEVRSRPQLTQATVEYHPQKRALLFRTGLNQPWPGRVRLLAESLSNPFAPPTELAQTSELRQQHWLTAELEPGQYVLRIILDEVALPLEETHIRFWVDKTAEASEQPQPLTEVIRGGGLIPLRMVEEFVTQWAERAESEQATLTPTTLYQLATVNAAAANLEKNFQWVHLHKLWSPLGLLRAVQKQTKWLKRYGYLPAWILLPLPLTLRTADHNLLLRVYPLEVGQGGRVGFGFGEWQLSPLDETFRELVYVQWQPISLTHVHVQAGLPDSVPENDWTAIDLHDMYSLYHCPRCGWLTGAYTDTLPAEIRQEHRHGRDQDDLSPINSSVNSDHYQLLAQLASERRGHLLLQAYATYGVVRPSSDYLPEPALPALNFLQTATRRLPLMALIREIKRLGHQGELPLWSSAARLIGAWQQEKNVSPLGQAVLALAVLLRTAAYYPRAFEKLRKAAAISEKNCQQLLAELNQVAPRHLEWGLTWAELLYLHSPER